ncbi:hypothetical protein [Grimontia sp. SpTr1]|uniref:hypothetical protein n=1 Tax=Grimontia sp. SpTr1 TaxID=2995319 RepID=UPI00248B3FB2|nr:hypothetical protein [Grimontia sp. SpTr1]
MKPKTFMQLYRAYKRKIQLNPTLTPTLDPDVVGTFGYTLTSQFMAYDNLRNKVGICNVHTRINYRFYITQKTHYWRYKAKRLNTMWRSWRHLTNGVGV